MKTTWESRFYEPQEQILQSVPAADSRHAGARRRFCDLLPSPAFAEASIISTQASTQRVMLGLNKSVVVDLPQDAYDILVANPAVADAVTRTSRRIYLFGKQGSARRTSLSSAPMASRLPASTWLSNAMFPVSSRISSVLCRDRTSPSSSSTTTSC